MDKINYFGTKAITQLVNLIKEDLTNKVDKIAGKNLSTNDYTNEEKDKLANISEEANKTIVIDNLVSAETASALSANQGKILDEKIAAVKTSVPMKVSELTNDSGFQTADQINAAITAAITGAIEEAY